MDSRLFSLGDIYQGPDQHYYTPLLPVEAGGWIFGQIVKTNAAWRLHEVVKPNGTRDRRCLLITRQAQGFSVVGVDLRSTPHLLYLDEIARTHFALTTHNLACLTYLAHVELADASDPVG